MILPKVDVYVMYVYDVYVMYLFMMFMMFMVFMMFMMYISYQPMFYFICFVPCQYIYIYISYI